VRVLLDESVPHDLGLALTGHEVTTVHTRGWAGLANGALLRAARDAGVEAVVTVDRNMEHQQQIARSGLALVVLEARTTRMHDLLPLVPALLDALAGATAGRVIHVAV
jgi:hypothetical protein